MFLPKLNNLWRSINSSAEENMESLTTNSDSAESAESMSVVMEGGTMSLKEERSRSEAATSRKTVHPASVPVRSLHRRLFEKYLTFLFLFLSICNLLIDFSYTLLSNFIPGHYALGKKERKRPFS